jgi:hypothetical protein
MTEPDDVAVTVARIASATAGDGDLDVDIGRSLSTYPGRPDSWSMLG